MGVSFAAIRRRHLKVRAGEKVCAERGHHEPMFACVMAKQACPDLMCKTCLCRISWPTLHESGRQGR